MMSLILVLVLLVSACSTDGNINNPNRPVDSNDPIPVEPDGGIGGGVGGEMEQADVYLNDVQLLIMESYPVQVAISITGDRPTPCHELQYSISEPDAENRILVEIFSEYDPGMTCLQVLDPFTENISLPVQGLPDGSYTVIVNGEEVGEFSYPG
jgi:hypothetical protein